MSSLCLVYFVIIQELKVFVREVQKLIAVTYCIRLEDGIDGPE